VSNGNYKIFRFVALAILVLLTAVTPAVATPFFSTGDPDGLIAKGSRPSSAGQTEIESAAVVVMMLSMGLTLASALASALSSADAVT
jgi:hypothetical protein